MGYDVSSGCISQDNPNIEVIKRLKQPTNVKELQHLLSSISMYEKFIP